LKVCFELNDNIVDKNLNHALFHDYQSTKRTNIAPFTSDIKHVYAKYFCDGDTKDAKRKLDRKNHEINRGDLIFISVFGSASIMMFIFLIWYAILSPGLFKKTLVWTGIEATGPVMRSTFIIIYILFAVGLVIKVFRQYDINYMHIFDLDERIRVR
jgi:hypothetical protein